MLKTTVAALAALCTLSGCVIVTDIDTGWGWGNWEQRTEDLGADVGRVEFDAAGTLYITQGHHHKLRLEGHGDTLDQLQVSDHNGILVISQQGEHHRWFEFNEHGREPVYLLQVDELTSVRHSGRGTVKLGPFSTDSMTIESSGHAKTYLASLNTQNTQITATGHAHIRIETLDSDHMRLHVNDHADLEVADANVLDADVHAQAHGELTLSGATDSLTLNARDHADVAARELTSAIATVRASDHARARLTVTEDLTLDERDQAGVTVHGSARVAQVRPD